MQCQIVKHTARHITSSSIGGWQYEHTYFRISSFAQQANNGGRQNNKHTMAFIQQNQNCANQEPIVSACRQFDVALLDRRRGRGAHPVEQDPWLTESGMAEAHHALQHAQEEERHLLTGSHQQLQDLETRRVDLIKKIVTAFLTSYRYVTISPTM